MIPLVTIPKSVSLENESTLLLVLNACKTIPNEIINVHIIIKKYFKSSNFKVNMIAIFKIFHIL